MSITARRPAGDPARTTLLDVDVRELMRPGVVSIASDASIRRAAQALLSHHVHAVLVVSEHGAALGWITAEGLVRAIGQDVAVRPASAAIAEPVVVVPPSMPAGEAAERLAQHRVSRLLVAEAEGRSAQGVLGAIDLVGLVA